jgi:DNA-binding response OmpR family regulator
MFSRSDERQSGRLVGTSRGTRVLIVDDCCDTAHACAKLLRLAGFEVATAFDGFEALRLASEFHPRITLLDIGLPDIDGFEVARRLRADARFKTMTLIAFTAFGSEEMRSRANEGDFDRFLFKPMPSADLLAVLLDEARGPADRTRSYPDLHHDSQPPQV